MQKSVLNKLTNIELLAVLDFLRNYDETTTTAIIIQYLYGNPHVDILSGAITKFATTFIIAYARGYVSFNPNITRKANKRRKGNIKLYNEQIQFLTARFAQHHDPDIQLSFHTTLSNDAAKKSEAKKTINLTVNDVEIAYTIRQLIADTLGLNDRIVREYISKQRTWIIPKKTADFSSAQIHMIQKNDVTYKLNSNKTATELHEEIQTLQEQELYIVNMPPKENIQVNKDIDFFYSDFETSVINEKTDKEFGIIWSWQISNYTKDILVQGAGFRAWIDTLIYLNNYYHINTNYFFNLKYDASFFMLQIRQEVNRYKELKILQTTTGDFFSIEFTVGKTIMKIIDLRRLLPQNMSLDDVAKDIVAPIMQEYPDLFCEPLQTLAKLKGEMSYDNRPINWKMTSEESLYQQSDCAIMEAFIITFRKLLGFSKLRLSLAASAKTIFESIANLGLLSFLVDIRWITRAHANAYYKDYLQMIHLPSGALSYQLTSIEKFKNMIRYDTRSQNYLLYNLSFKKIYEQLCANDILREKLKDELLPIDFEKIIGEVVTRRDSYTKKRLIKVLEIYGLSTSDKKIIESEYKALFYEWENDKKISHPQHMATKSGIQRLLTMLHIPPYVVKPIGYGQKLSIAKLHRKNGYMFYNIYSEHRIELLNFARKAYKGGKTETNPMNVNQIHHDVMSMDKRSMHPSQIVYHELPFGSGRFVEPGTAKEPHTMYIHEIEILQDKHIETSPVLNKELTKNRDDYFCQHIIRDFKKGMILHEDGCITDYLQKKDVRFKIHRTLMYYTANIHALGVAIMYIEREKHRVAELQALQRTEKMLLNAYIGKFGQADFFEQIDPKIVKVKNNASKVMYIRYNTDDDVQRAIAMEDWQHESLRNFNGAYNRNVAIASHITAQSRLDLCKVHDWLGYEHVINGDTDSVKAFAKPFIQKLRKGNLPFVINPKVLGAWDMEEYYEEFFSLGLKRYAGIYNEKASFGFKMQVANILGIQDKYAKKTRKHSIEPIYKIAISGYKGTIDDKEANKAAKTAELRAVYNKLADFITKDMSEIELANNISEWITGGRKIYEGTFKIKRNEDGLDELGCALSPDQDKVINQMIKQLRFLFPHLDIDVIDSSQRYFQNSRSIIFTLLCIDAANNFLCYNISTYASMQLGISEAYTFYTENMIPSDNILKISREEKDQIRQCISEISQTIW